MRRAALLGIAVAAALAACGDDGGEDAEETTTTTVLRTTEEEAPVASGDCGNVPRLQVGGVIMTMFDSRINLAKQVVEEVRQHLPDKIFQTLIPRTVRLSEAPSFGKPIVQYDVLSSGAQGYLGLAREVMARTAEPAPASGDA